MRIFKERGITATGKVLSYDEFMRTTYLNKQKFVDERMPEIIAKAEEYLETDIPMIPLSTYISFFTTGSREPYVGLQNVRRNMVLALSIAEAYERSGRFISKLCDAIWAILEETTWVMHAHRGHNPGNPTAMVPPVYNETDLHGVDLVSAGTGAVLAAALLLHRDAFGELSPIFVERMEYELEKKIIKPFISFHHSWSGAYGDKCNNWVTYCVESVLFVTAVVEKRHNVRESVVNRALSYLDNYTNWMPDDGGCDEGPGYWSGAAASYFTALETIYDMTGGAIDVFDHELIRNMGEFIYKFNIHGKSYINFADCSPNVSPNAQLVIRYGERCGSEGMVAYGKMLARGETAIKLNYRNPYRALKDVATPLVTEAETTKAALNVWLPDLKVMVSRDSEDTSKGMFVAIKGGHNKQSHNHNDVGSYIIYKNGMPSVIDPGNVTYTKDVFGPNRYTIWVMQSHYHNLPAFDEMGEPNGPVYTSTRESYDPDTHKLTLGLERAYDRRIGVREYTRGAVLKDGVVTVSEDIALEVEREIDFRLMTLAEPKRVDDGRLELVNGVTLTYDARLEYSSEEVDPVGMNCTAHWGTEKLYRLHFKTRAKDFKCEFIYN